MKTSVVVKSSGKEYPNFTKEQIRELIGYLKQGMSEQEAEDKVLNK
jgi:hypothetical protein